MAKSIIAFLDKSPASIPIKRGRAREVKNFGILSFIRIIFLIKVFIIVYSRRWKDSHGKWGSTIFMGLGILRGVLFISVPLFCVFRYFARGDKKKNPTFLSFLSF